jgi:hypothetical protein
MACAVPRSPLVTQTGHAGTCARTKFDIKVARTLNAGNRGLQQIAVLGDTRRDVPQTISTLPRFGDDFWYARGQMT